MTIEHNGHTFTVERENGNGMWIVHKDGVQVDRDWYRNDIEERIRSGRYD